MRNGNRRRVRVADVGRLSQTRASAVRRGVRGDGRWTQAASQGARGAAGNGLNAQGECCMVREADLIRSEIDQIRSNLDSKLIRLEARAREMTPRRVAQRFVRERAFEQVVGSTLMFAGALMAWRKIGRAHV